VSFRTTDTTAGEGLKARGSGSEAAGAQPSEGFSPAPPNKTKSLSPMPSYPRLGGRRPEAQFRSRIAAKVSPAIFETMKNGNRL
jgi:hypothetical protein